MRQILIAFAALVAATAANINAGTAQSTGPKPWCIANGAFGSGTMDCTYWTLQQCLASASGAGGTCRENPRYHGDPRTPATQGRNPREGWR